MPIYYGADSPAIICGRHATYLSAGAWEIMREAGAVPAFPKPIIDTHHREELEQWMTQPQSCTTT